MGGRIDRAKGRVKEAAGVLTGDKDLRRRGRSDQVVGGAKLNLDKGSDEAKRAIDRGAAQAETWLAKGKAGAGRAIDRGNAALQRVMRRQR